MSQWDADAIVIGSGFGGATVALRLGQADRTVMLLERGRRYSLDDFPDSSKDANRIFWRQRKDPEARGLYELAVYADLAAIVSSGLGGGSLIWANVLARPDPVVFEDSRWPHGMTRPALDPLYDHIIAGLGASPVPATLNLAKRNQFRAAAVAIGERHYDPPQAVTWEGHAGPGREACRLCASCELTCRFGAKNTLDYRYLAHAEHTLGCQVRTDALVTHIEPITDGYAVHGINTPDGSPFRATAPQVVVAAGTLGTLDILFRSRDAAATLPQLSDRLGHGISCNGDYFGNIVDAAQPINGHHGPDVTTILVAAGDDAPFTVVAPSFNKEAMTFLAAQGQLRGFPIPLVSDAAWRTMGDAIPAVFASGAVRDTIARPPEGTPDPARMTNLFAIGRDNAGGRASFENDRVEIRWAYAKENAALVARMDATLAKLAKAYGGRYAPLATWSFFKKPLTVHPLGGCAMADAATEGVVSPTGEVHGYPGLFVADGSMLPTSLGVHPALTIAALAERVAAGMV